MLLSRNAFLRVRSARFQRGLSLLEMVVAMAILGISLGVLYQAVGGASRIVQTSERYAYAVTIAESLLADNAVVPDVGLALSGETGGDYRWSVDAKPVSSDDDLQPVQLMAIRIEVVWGDAKIGRYELNSIVAGVPSQ